MKKIESNKSITRFGVSIPLGLIRAFDKYIREREYSNRSEAIRDLIREKLIEQEWEKEFEGQVVVGAITYVFDHHKRELVDSIIDIQHNFPDHVIVSQHVHLDHHNCLEVAIVRGEPDALRNLAYKLKALKGVKHCQLTMTTTGTSLS
ncbi:MAG: nickel-responsive transcriptional regulator NikR [Deltaproteobacteria bacterium]|nr:nickel-responsive transcriptional regulator NikR [Deltaproteobacteria bacterium]MBW1967187.1 nickel-responsive transcriptional regulator NikR [Deltaproteobacteria bacterium]MBW2098166.1 nickel-responsive transcriptional regulator NikR [Deltaproteobacteria bacterium]PXF54697.1 MAG: nickel-responsive transcriptional regulator NikR [Deltaproteobacteria bacterium]RKX60677.1 MAG: nickel-responsive transcriptional regulator NikR [Thermodesulfobacteriota bacterium]